MIELQGSLTVGRMAVRAALIAEVTASQLPQYEIVADLFSPSDPESLTWFPLTFRIFAMLV